MSLNRCVLLALLGAAFATAGQVGGGAKAAADSCGGATALRGAPILELGPLRIAGFSSGRCAWLRPGCGPRLGGYQSPLSLELPGPPASPIVLRAEPSEPVAFVLVGRTTPAPKVPRCVSAAGARGRVVLRAPKAYFVLFVFASRGVRFHLSASRGGHRLGSAVLVCRA